MRGASRFSRECSLVARLCTPAQMPMLPTTANQLQFLRVRCCRFMRAIWTMTRFERCSMSLHRKLVAFLEQEEIYVGYRDRTWTLKSPSSSEHCPILIVPPPFLLAAL